ncbi:protein disulfide isomerase [Babesia gibsoni]|uniref:protein disulfide-isomerase n=1 Tax=Babesia gibsoni TaxID=33632 RepID=A0AAD8LMW5_BABGI|nr:protein disulfide isomerase [Babesia gibsoni]
MKFLSPLVPLFFAGFLATANGADPEGAVVQLTESNIHKFIEEHETVLVKFYAPWCMHCQSLAPEYEKAAKTLAEEGSSMVLAEINCDESPNVAQEFAIEGYPTLKYFRKAAPRDYTGPRQAEGIVAWCNEIMLPAVVNIHAAADVTDFSVISFVARGYPETDPLFKEYENLADLYRGDAKFFFAAEEGKGIFVIHQDQGKFEFEGKTPEELVEFVQQESLPLFDEIGHGNYVRYFNSGKAISWFCSKKEDYEKFRPSFVKAARALRSTVLFVWLDVEKFTAASEAFAIDTFPAVAHQTDNGRYIMTQDAYDFGDLNAVLKFYSDVAAGVVKRSIKSEDEPEQDESPVVTLVGKTLEKFVNEARKPILLMIHSPFCEHCKKFMPVFTSFGENVGKDGKVVVATLNGDANESPLDHVQWKAYPTVLLLKPGVTEAVPYEGKRTLEDLTAFVDEHAVGERNEEL